MNRTLLPSAQTLLLARVASPVHEEYELTAPFAGKSHVGDTVQRCRLKSCLFGLASVSGRQGRPPAVVSLAEKHRAAFHVSGDDTCCPPRPQAPCASREAVVAAVCLPPLWHGDGFVCLVEKPERSEGSCSSCCTEQGRWRASTGEMPPLCLPGDRRRTSREAMKYAFIPFDFSGQCKGAGEKSAEIIL